MKQTLARMAAVGLLTGILLTGCYDSVDFTWYEAGVYKGKEDPLRERLTTLELQETLEARAMAVQTDR